MEKEYEELKKRYFALLRKYEELKYNYAVFTQMSNEIIDNSILKQKILDKIEKCEKKIDEYSSQPDINHDLLTKYISQKRILQELLESER